MSKYSMTKDERNYVYQKMQKAINDGLSNAKAEWKNHALRLLFDYAVENEVFTANDVTPLIKAMPIKTHDNRAIGGLVKFMEGAGWISGTGRKIASKNGNMSRIEIWRSNIYKKRSAKITQPTLL